MYISEFFFLSVQNIMGTAETTLRQVSARRQGWSIFCGYTAALHTTSYCIQPIHQQGECHFLEFVISWTGQTVLAQNILLSRNGAVQAQNIWLIQRTIRLLNRTGKMKCQGNWTCRSNNSEIQDSNKQIKFNIGKRTKKKKTVESFIAYLKLLPLTISISEVISCKCLLDNKSNLT